MVRESENLLRQLAREAEKPTEERDGNILDTLAVAPFFAYSAVQPEDTCRRSSVKESWTPTPPPESR